MSRQCKWCNKETNNPQFCSLSCSSSFNAKYNPRDKIWRPKNCEQCGVEFNGVGDGKVKKFCSRSCSAKFNNKVRGNRTAKPNCIECGERLKKNAQLYCSHACTWIAKRRENVNGWLAGEIDGGSVNGCNKWVRDYLIVQAGNKCSKCEWSEVNLATGNVPLQINHIDGRSDNNRPENLEVLCPNCHSLTDNFGSLNKNSSRVYRYFKIDDFEYSDLTDESILVE